MPWFQKLCRQAGLAVHRVTTPDAPSKVTKTVRETVEESQPEPGVTLRRTTVEEIEFRPPAAPPADPPPGPSDPSK